MELNRRFRIKLFETNSFKEMIHIICDVRQLFVRNDDADVHTNSLRF